MRKGIRNFNGIDLTPLHSAVQQTDIVSIRKFAVSYKKWVNVGDKNGRNSLHWAARIEFVANTNAMSIDGYTPLHETTANGHTEVVKLLASEFCADVNVKSKGGWTPLQLAAENGHVDVTRLLVIEFSADANTKTKIVKC
ncbi:ankyrin repeat protein [Endogone sp. FLAS-F59071]|nr:ankyrin repeat protein [Endogone sp. FLAS-F59071]|eukprot:RUS20569.1 ankyrin repeat protein [Endogone sp. FLAS-F59071]